MARIQYIPNRVIDTNGISDGAQVFLYQSGTTTKVALFSDESLSTPILNPVVVPAGAEIPVFYTSYTGALRLRVVADDGSVPQDEDPYFGSASIADVSEVRSDLASTANDKGAGLSGFSAESAYPSDTVGRKLQESVSIEDFGASPENSDNTAFIQAAIDYGRDNGCAVLVPANGRAYLTGKLTLYEESCVYSPGGRFKGRLKLKNGANTNLMETEGWNFSTPTVSVKNIHISGIHFDGNRANNTAGDLLCIFGPNPYVSDCWFTDAPEQFLVSNWIDVGAELMEGNFKHLKMKTSGKHGFIFMGPHDSHIDDVVIVDAGQTADSTYTGFYALGGNANARVSRLHVWNFSFSFRHKYAAQLNGAYGMEFDHCHFEGAWTANVYLLNSQQCVFADTNRYYAAWNGKNVIFGNGARFNTFHGILGQNGPSRPECSAITFGEGPSDFVAFNRIDVQILDNNVSLIDFNYNGGGNDIKIKAYKTPATGSAYTGTPAANDKFTADVFYAATGVYQYIDNKLQNGTVTIPNASPATVTFDFPFAVAPIIQASPTNPAAGLNGEFWLSSIGTTSFNIYNDTGQTVTFSWSATHERN